MTQHYTKTQNDALNRDHAVRSDTDALPDQPLSKSLRLWTISRLLDIALSDFSDDVFIGENRDKSIEVNNSYWYLHLLIITVN